MMMMMMMIVSNFAGSGRDFFWPGSIDGDQGWL